MRIAITGGIGSGKSVVLALLQKFGQKVVSCDEINASLLVEPKYIQKIKEQFPLAVKDNKIDKQVLSSIVFNDKQKLALLNQIAHPIIREIALTKSSGEGITFVEVPLLFESNMQSDYDKVIVVTASEEVRISRASVRDNKPSCDIKKIIDNQIKDYIDKKIDYFIDNSGSISELEDKVKDLLDNINKN